VVHSGKDQKYNLIPFYIWSVHTPMLMCVCVVAGLWAEQPMNHGLSSIRRRDFFLFQEIQPGSVAHLPSSSVANRVLQADHSPLSSAKLKNEWHYFATLCICLWHA
jgi:hypothetical protein